MRPLASPTHRAADSCHLATWAAQHVKPGRWRSWLAGALLLAGHAHAQVPAEELTLGWPIDCQPGHNCHVLAYVDKLPGPGFQDFGGGRQTYDDHDGTDFGIANEALMQNGVTVRAAAAGTVLRVRDGVTDKRVQSGQEAQAVSPIGCGNAVVIDHPDNWRTTYCHLRKGSLIVKEGAQVAKGAPLGLVGLSGLTSYPHVHLGVQHRGVSIDPFTGVPATQTATGPWRPLWDKPLPYIAAGLISSGFSSQKPQINSVWQGTASPPVITTGSAALHFWVHPFGVLAGDVEQLRLLDPQNQTVVEKSSVIAQANRINWLNSIATSPTPGQALDAGIWQGQYQLRRGDQLLVDIRREIEVVAQ